MIPILCKNLTVVFDGVRAVDSLDLEIEEGAIYGLLGPNGAGKTTAIKAMMNLLPPTSGVAEIYGRSSRSLTGDSFQKIGYVSENQLMPDWMTVGYLMAYLKPFYPSWDDTRAAELMRQFDLPKNRKLRDLSRGMWMKAALASSLAYRPRLLVLDEPFSGLDALVREELIEGILMSAEDSTILVSSHDLSDIETFSSHVGYMDKGRILLSEEMTALSQRFREIEVTLGQVADLQRDHPWPAHWLRPEVSPALVRFVDSQFDQDSTTAEIRHRFQEVRDIAARPMPLRAIFLALARSSRKFTSGALA
ncbi:MAG TPA: ABC transporter ATP-binding protein [Bryobacteraceae bacterium]|nr:ABC transporter ATP-binding protein [Bryobacteraceae bacterium]